MSPGAAPTVSVVVPTYHSVAYLAETIESVLTQTLPPHEVIVVDDGSTDDTVATAQRYGARLTVLCGDHVGTAANRQRGFAASRGDLVAACDADDVWLPTKLERQVATLVTNPDVDAVGCLADEFLSPDVDESHTPGRGLRTRAPSVAASALVIRRGFLTCVGGFDSILGPGESVEWFARALRAGIRTHIVDEVLVRRRIHANNASRSFGTDKQTYLDIVRNHLETTRHPR